MLLLNYFRCSSSITFENSNFIINPPLRPNDIDLPTWKRKCAILKSSLTIAGGTQAQGKPNVCWGKGRLIIMNESQSGIL